MFYLQKKLTICMICLLTTASYAAEKPAEHVKVFFTAQTEQFLKDLYVLAEKEKAGLPEKKLRPYFLKARLSFKRIEFLLVYSDNQESKYINGPNLVVNNYNKRAPNEEIQPRGLQVIEALIYEPDDSGRTELRSQISQLINLVEKILKRYQQMQNYDEIMLNKVIWDALRYELYRIETLGITGFDVPVCLNAIPEAKASLESFAEVVAFYKPLLDESAGKNLFETGNTLLTNTQIYLEKNNNFNQFDRYEFIVSYLHPLSEWVHTVQLETGFKIADPSRPVNPNVPHLFDKNILNPFYFPDATDTLKIKLGERLFHDPVFSADRSRSCASCHLPEKAYTDGMKQNTVLGGTDLLRRNTPSLLNAGYQTRFFYDSRVISLEKQILDVIHNKQEMNGNFSEAVRLIAADSSYTAQFNQAYKSGITEANALHALANFVRSLVSFDSKFDRNIRGVETTLTPQEIHGFNLFAGQAKCATCHFIPMFNGLVPPFYEDTESEILGVPFSADRPAYIDTDGGKFEFTGLDLHRNSFKTPGVRNVSLTAPYMHNGVFNTLEEVMDFYNKGGGAGQGMELPDQTLSSENLGLTPAEIAAIIAFLETLNDTAPNY